MYSAVLTPRGSGKFNQNQSPVSAPSETRRAPMDEVEHIAEVSQAERYVATLFLQCREIASFFEAPEADKARPVPIPPSTPPPVQPKHIEEDDEFLGGAANREAVVQRRHKLDKATAIAEEIEVPCPINQFALLIEIRLKNQEVLSRVVEMNVDTEDPGTLSADLGRVASLVPLAVRAEEAMELSLSATLVRKSDGALKTLGQEYINAQETLLEQWATFLLVSRPAALVSTRPGHYWFDLFVSLTDRGDAVASLDTLQIQQLDVGLECPLPIKNVLAFWAELGDWM
ncbi:hypothetical protein AK812_SmicGene6921 [Symbiodinium microadriaticum]|uniref:Uncharacterized protein n=1 Tax=Symbiodinium microadriaticum TaxID=2951 RepID=A0A1Q9EPW0_SYMMI|nr:hypothetical protein AK812_SmicGene6921 [Symbiodinium microadriaticum]